MPTPNPSLRREYKGAAAATTLQNSMVGTDTSFVLVAANNWPTGAVGKFIVTINRGQADEEKILCDSQTTRTVACLLANRGFDGTTAQAHAAGATVECTISAFDADEWNQHTNATGGVHGAAGAVVGTTDAQTLTNKTLTAPTINGGVADAASTIGGVTGTAIAAARAAWTAYTPALTNAAVGNGTITGRYLQMGKTVFFTAQFTLGSTSAVGTQPTVSAPVAGQAASYVVAGQAYDSSANALYTIVGSLPTSGTAIRLGSGGGDVTASVPFVWAVGDNIVLSGVYESA